ncbi:hypothetical protein FALCPG4_014858 [Fusarium falciforme]
MQEKSMVKSPGGEISPACKKWKRLLPNTLGSGAGVEGLKVLISPAGIHSSTTDSSVGSWKLPASVWGVNPFAWLRAESGVGSRKLAGGSNAGLVFIPSSS